MGATWPPPRPHASAFCNCFLLHTRRPSLRLRLLLLPHGCGIIPSLVHRRFFCCGNKNRHCLEMHTPRNGNSFGLALFLPARLPNHWGASFACEDMDADRCQKDPVHHKQQISQDGRVQGLLCGAFASRVKCCHLPLAWSPSWSAAHNPLASNPFVQALLH